jgi:hypothetical protein
MTGSEGAKPDATSRGKGFEGRPPLLPADAMVLLSTERQEAVTCGVSSRTPVGYRTGRAPGRSASVRATVPLG